MDNIITLVPRNAGRNRAPRKPARLRVASDSVPDWGGDAVVKQGGRYPPSVIIVDDQFTGRKILEELIQSIDPALIVESFADPYEALRHAGRQTPDLILTDYKMPDLNGVEFTRRLRAMPSCVDVPLVVVTVVEDPEVRYEALDAGATDFLVRPIDQYECRARCRNLLTLRRQQKIITHRAHWLEEQVSLATRQIRNRERETLLRLAKAGEYRDQGSGDHVMRMAKLARLIAEQMGLSAVECDEIELAAPMHDIGKIGIPDQVLLKPGELTPAEWEVMKMHTTIGHEILKNSASRYIQQGAVIALSHHEHYDGGGYPHGLRGDAIPLVSRIVTVADVYDALISKRSYKQAWSREDAIRYVTEQAGHHFDPRCVAAFIAQLAEIERTAEGASAPEA
ncbi:MAG: HD domain-containing phosphohydrolase [Gammaproteobacteria bacterium]